MLANSGKVGLHRVDVRDFGPHLRMSLAFGDFGCPGDFHGTHMAHQHFVSRVHVSLWFRTSS